MRTIKITTLIAICVITIAACKTSKKSTTSTASSAPPVAVTTTTTSNLPAAKPANGIYEPGNEELLAIQGKYTDITLDKLKLGHALYAEGPCVQCHRAKNIYKIEESDCKGLIERMSKKAKITDEQQDAVYKYVLAIRAAQPK